jgi:Domain of unknown function (DUF6468)
MFSIALDLLLALLLATGIAYAWRLHRRLKALHTDRAALEDLVAGLSESAMRAEAGIAGLRAAADQIGDQLQKKLERGRALGDDLGYMLDRGGQLADRLEEAVRLGREVAAMREKPSLAVVPRESADENRTGSRVERELRRVLEARRG